MYVIGNTGDDASTNNGNYGDDCGCGDDYYQYDYHY